MLKMTLYMRQQKRHRCKEQILDSVGEGESAMYITICEVDEQFKIDVLNRALKAGALGQPRGMGWGERLEGDLEPGNTCTPVLIYGKTLIPSLIAQLVKDPPPMEETLVPSLGRKDPLVKG